LTKTKTIHYTLLASILFGFIFHGLALGQGNPVHFNPVANTGQTHPILVNAATINKVPLSVGDEIAVFDGQLCAGAIRVQTFPIVFPSIMRQIVYTDTLPGAVSGHAIQFRIWDADRQSEIYGIPDLYKQGNGNFGAFITEVDTLKATVIDITVNTNPSNFTYYVNGLSFTTSRTFSMNVGQTFYLSVDSIPSVPGMPPGERYRLSQWASNDLQSTTNATFAYVVPASPAIATATFMKQYFLTTAEEPDEGGNVAPPPPGAWYDNSATATAIAAPAAGYLWNYWTGDYTANNDTTTVLMNAPKTITAHFGSNIAKRPFIFSRRNTIQLGSDLHMDHRKSAHSFSQFPAGRSHRNPVCICIVEQRRKHDPHLYSTWISGYGHCQFLHPVSAHCEHGARNARRRRLV
jgi:hypothetical protein